MRLTTLFALAVSLLQSFWLATAWMPPPSQRASPIDTTACRRQHARARVRLDNNNKRRQTPPVGDNDGASYSYVEGLEFDNERDEILAMGGDPSFLPPEDNDDNGATDAAAAAPPPPETEEPKFLWDGEVIEDAYFDD